MEHLIKVKDVGPILEKGREFSLIRIKINYMRVSGKMEKKMGKEFKSIFMLI
jgi:hypothetical protein